MGPCLHRNLKPKDIGHRDGGQPRPKWTSVLWGGYSTAQHLVCDEGIDSCLAAAHPDPRRAWVAVVLPKKNIEQALGLMGHPPQAGEMVR